MWCNIHLNKERTDWRIFFGKKTGKKRWLRYTIQFLEDVAANAENETKIEKRDAP
jgi:hypothetical protein